jgi:hypothetical protein
MLIGETRQYQQLAENLSQCFEAKCLQSVFDVSGALSTRKFVLETRVREISELLVAKGQRPFDSSDCQLLRQLHDSKTAWHYYYLLPLECGKCDEYGRGVSLSISILWRHWSMECQGDEHEMDVCWCNSLRRWEVG